MYKKAEHGLCKLCGNSTSLTYEHVPPKNAGNRNRFYVFSMDSLTEDPFAEKLRGRPFQGGIGYYSLCEPCNNKTGAWYGKAYIDFVNQAVYRLRLSNVRYGSGDPFVVHPLKVIKQVVSFFISIGAGNYFHEFPELTNFVLDKRCQLLPDNFQVFIYYNDSVNYRYMADNSLLNNGIIYRFSEMSHFPFGFLFSFVKTEMPLEGRLFEITSWKNYPYDCNDRMLSLPLKKLPVELAMFPGDYRTRDEIEKAIGESERTYGKTE